MRVFKKKGEFGYYTVEVWLDGDDFQALVNRRRLSLRLFDVEGSAAGWASVQVTLKLQKAVKPEQKLF